MNNPKPPLGLQPRQIWLRNRVAGCVHALVELQDVQDWETYREHAKILASELSYAVTEWEKYYE